MNDEYTPTTEEVMDAYCRNQGPAPRTGPEFRRWLAEHDRKVKADAWDEALDMAWSNRGRLVNPYRTIDSEEHN